MIKSVVTWRKKFYIISMQSVTLHDEQPVWYSDLSSIFYLTEDDFGHNRAEIICPKLAELNNYVSVTSDSDRLESELIREHSVIVLVNARLAEQLRVAEMTR